MKIRAADLDKDPIRRMNWKATSFLKKHAFHDPIAQYILDCRKNKMYPADTNGQPIRDWSDDYEC